MERRVEQDRSDGDIRLQEGTRVRHDGPRKLVLALVLLSIRRSGSTKQRNSKNISAAREPILRLGKDGDTVAVLAQVCVL